MNLLKSAVHWAGRRYIRTICASEAEGQKFSVHNECPIEYRFALQCLADGKPTSVLDVGTGTTAWPPLMRHCGYIVTAIDNVRDYWPKGMVNRHWTVLDVDIQAPGTFAQREFDAVTCISVREHIEDHEQAVRNMAKLLKTGGSLILTTPYSQFNPYPNVYRHPDALYGTNAPYICRSSSAAEMERWVGCGLTLERRELWRLFTGPVWATGARCKWERVDREDQPHQLGCFLFRKS